MIDPATHAVTEFPIPTADSDPAGHHDRARRQPLVHRVRRQPDRDDRPGDRTRHRVPHAHARQSTRCGITAGPDGNLWFTEESVNQIGTINPDDARDHRVSHPRTGRTPGRITAGPDGNLWFTESTVPTRSG